MKRKIIINIDCLVGGIVIVAPTSDASIAELKSKVTEALQEVVDKVKVSLYEEEAEEKAAEEAYAQKMIKVLNSYSDEVISELQQSGALP